MSAHSSTSTAMSSWKGYVELSLLSVIAFVALVGNTLVVVLIWRSPRATCMTNLFVGHMGAANLVVPVACCPVYIYLKAPGYGVEDASCKAVLFLHLINSFVSVFMLACMSLDKYYVIVYPLSVRLSRDEAVKLIALVWFLALAAACTVVYFAYMAQVNDSRYCAVPSNRVGWQVFFSLYFAFAVVSPLAFILVIDVRIVLAIWRRNSSRGLPVEQLTCCSRDCRAVGMSGRVPRVKRETTRLMILQDILYILCWLPYFSREIYQFGLKEDFGTRDWLICLAFSNAALNPVLYAILCSNFRRGCNHFVSFCVSRRYSVSKLGRLKNRVGVIDWVPPRTTQTKDSLDSCHQQRESLFGIRITATGAGLYTVRTSIESRFKNAFSVADHREAWVS